MVLLDKRHPGPVRERPRQRLRVQPIPDPEAGPRRAYRAAKEQLVVDRVNKSFKKRALIGPKLVKSHAYSTFFRRGILQKTKYVAAKHSGM